MFCDVDDDDDFLPVSLRLKLLRILLLTILGLYSSTCGYWNEDKSL